MIQMQTNELVPLRMERSKGVVPGKELIYSDKSAGFHLLSIFFFFFSLSLSARHLKHCCSRGQLRYTINHREDGRAGKNPQGKIYEALRVASCQSGNRKAKLEN